MGQWPESTSSDKHDFNFFIKTKHTRKKQDMVSQRGTLKTHMNVYQCQQVSYNINNLTFLWQGKASKMYVVQLMIKTDVIKITFKNVWN